MAAAAAAVHGGAQPCPEETGQAAGSAEAEADEPPHAHGGAPEALGCGGALSRELVAAKEKLAFFHEVVLFRETPH